MIVNCNKIEINLEKITDVMKANKYESHKVNVYSLTSEEQIERMYVEKYNSFPVVTLFDELIEMIEDIPDQQYYIDWYLYKSYEWIEAGKANYKNKQGKWEKIQWTETTVKVLTDRASRAYYSRMMELYIMAIIKEYFPEINIYSNPVLDIYGAVDIMLFNQENQKVIYAHVLKESYTATTQLNTKSVERRKFYYKDIETNKRYDFSIDRDFSSHTALTYGNRATSENLNGYLVPTPESIISQITSEFNRTDLEDVENPEYLCKLITAVSEAFPEIHFIDLSDNEYNLVS